MEDSAVAITQIVVQIVSPLTLIAVVIYMLRDLKGDLREFRSEVNRKVDKLSEDHVGLARELSELRGEISART